MRSSESAENKGAEIVELLEQQFGSGEVQKIKRALGKYHPGTDLAHYIQNLPEPAALQASIRITDSVIAQAYLQVLTYNLGLDLM